MPDAPTASADRAPFLGHVLAGPALFVLLSPWIHLSMRFLTFSLDVSMLNTLRGVAGVTTLFTLAWLKTPAQLTHALRSRRESGLLLLGSLLIIAAQGFMVKGVALTSATMGSLIQLVGIPLTIILSALFFADERATAKHPTFIAGAALALTGSLGIALAGERVSVDHGRGVAYLLLAVLSGTSFSLLIRYLLDRIAALPAAAVSSVLPLMGFTVFAAMYGRFEPDGASAGVVVLVAVASGGGGYLVGNALRNRLVQELGLSRMTLLRLTLPVLTALLEVMLMGQTLTFAEILFGLLVLAGCALSVPPPDRGTPGPRAPGTG